MPDRIVSVSTAPYDGYPVPVALDSLAACGARHVEPAYIVGYTEPFDEGAFTDAAAAAYAGWLAASGLGCHAMSSHIDLGREDAVMVFRRRMDFARRLGARVINTNAAIRGNADQFARNIEPLARHAEAIGLTIGLENPGDGRDNLVNDAAEGLALIGRLGLACVRLNHDPANTASHRPDLDDPVRDALAALPGCAHLHLKDVRRTEHGWFFTPLGEGDLGLDRLLAALADWPGMPVGIELPLRLHRDAAAQPRRSPVPVPLSDIEAAVRRSLNYVVRHGL
jgi:sugar phosphate isomerase/epimerase